MTKRNLSQSEILKQITEISQRISKRNELIDKVNAGEHLDITFQEELRDLGDIEERDQIVNITKNNILPILQKRQAQDRKTLNNLMKSATGGEGNG